MIVDIDTNFTNLTRDMCATIDRIAIHVEDIAKDIKGQSSRQLPRDTKNDDIREYESITLSIEEELKNPTLDGDKDIMECDKVPLILEGEFQDPSLVEKNEFAIKVELSLKEMQVEKKHPELIVENVLVGLKSSISH